MVVGETLLDIYPDKKYVGGAPFNFAFHLNGLGLRVKFVSRVGDDDAGREILDFAHSFDFPVEGIQVDPERPTGEVRVTLDDNGVPDFDIIPERAYDFIEANAYTESLAQEKIRLIYLGTLVQRSAVSSASVMKFLADLRQESMVMADLNLRAPFYNKDVVEFTLQSCDILKISAEELAEIHQLLQYKGTPQQLTMFLRERYEIGVLCLTKGEKGSELYEAGNFEPFVAEAAKVTSNGDAVGAGDAFAAMLATGLLFGWHRQEILQKASEFSAKVCEIPGALPSDPGFYEPFKVQ